LRFSLQAWQQAADAAAFLAHDDDDFNSDI